MLNFHKNYKYLVIKKYMYSASAQVVKHKINQEFVDQNEIQEDPIVEQHDTPIVHEEPRQTTITENASEKFKSFFKPNKRADIDDRVRQGTQSVFMSMNDGNTSLDNSKSLPDNILPSDTSVKAIITDVALKSICTNVESITNSLGSEIKKSEELAKEWKINIVNFDKFIKSLT